MLFGEYHFRPFTYVGYRVNNGPEDTGRVADFLSHVIPSLTEGVSLKRQAIEAAIREGKTAIDSSPWV
jgi:hypothetical protein